MSSRSFASAARRRASKCGQPLSWVVRAIGTRMKSAVPKVLHRIAGRSMLGHVLDAAQAARSMGESDLAMMQGDKRIRNARMKEELGVVLRYPSYREGIPAALAEEDAGKH